MAYVYPPIPPGVDLCDVPMRSFSTSGTASGIAGGPADRVFIAPALDEAANGPTVDILSIEVRGKPADTYQVQQTENVRPFMWGPPDASPAGSFPPAMDADLEPTFNDPSFGFLKTEPEVVGVMTNTTTDETVVILY